MKTLAEVQELVEALPHDADKIAEYFEREAIVGNRSAFSCPVANYLRRNGAEGPSVSEVGIMWSAEGALETPSWLVTFIRRFDMGRYPRIYTRIV